MCKILGYGEDAFTLWALKHRTSTILQSFRDKTIPSNCLIFYRPSFGRSGGKGSAEFGEFDAILASQENVYLIESKWDNLSTFKDETITIRPEQKLRHHILSWYIMHWDKKYHTNWEIFMKEHVDDFQKKFPRKRIAPLDSLLATNLEFVLATLHRKTFSSEIKVKNVLLFFYNGKKSAPPTATSRGFNLIHLDYSQKVESNFIQLNRTI